MTVAVLDTGVDPSLPDLSGSVTTGPDFTNSGRTAGKPFWGIHGTEVASLIAGHGHGPNHSEGIAGIAPAAKILSVRVTLEANDPLLSDAATAAALPDAIARGITYAVRHGAKVIDLPLDPVTTPGAAGSGGSPAERRAVRRALAHHVVLVAPAGDNGAGADAANYPAAYRGVISVGAFDSRFFKAPFTSHQRYVTLTAAGQGVTAENPVHGYKTINSTSAASAMVAGVAALIKSQFPAMTPAQVTRALTQSTAFRPKDGRNNGSGYGTLDAAAALMTAAKIAEAVPKSAQPAGGSPPVAPTVHPAVASPNLGRTLAVDAAIALVVFVLLLGVILAIRSGQRRRARSARLAEVRAAAQVQPPAPPPPPAVSLQPGITTAPPVPAIPGMPAAGSVSGAGSLPGAVASRVSNSTTEPAPSRAKRSAPNPAKPTPLPLRNPLARHEAAAAAAPEPASAQPAAPQPATAQPAEPQSAAPYGMTSAGLPRRVQPSASAFPQSAFPSGTTGGSLFASSGSGTSGGSLFASGGGGQATPPSAAPAPGSAHGGAAPGGKPSSAFPDSAFPDRDFPDRASPGKASPDRAFTDRAFTDRAFTDRAFRGGPLADPPPAASPAQPPRAQPPPAPEGAGEPHASTPPAAPPRTDTVHRPSVSGRPPWEPAERPDSELPWNQAPAAPQAEAPVLPQRSPGYSDGVTSWDAIAEEVWPGGPQAGVPHPPAPPVAEPASLAPRVPRTVGGWGGAAPAAEDGAQRDRPIYVWSPDPGDSTPPATPATTPASGAPPWEAPAPGGAAEDSNYRNAPPWDDLGAAPPKEPGRDDPLAGFGAGGFDASGLEAGGLGASGSSTPGAAAPAGIGWQPASVATPAERADSAPPEEESGLGSAYLPAAPKLPAAPGAAPGLPGVPGGTNGSYPPPTPGGTANSYLWSAKSDPMGASFPAERSEAARSFGPGPGSFDAAQAGESTETFGAVTPESGKSLWRLSLPTESTETFPAVPRGDGEGRKEDS